jgi:hypothetical protein
MFPAYIIANFAIAQCLFENFVALAVGCVGTAHAILLFYPSFSI